MLRELGAETVLTDHNPEIARKGEEESMEESTMVKEAARPHLKVLANLATQLNEASDRFTEELKAIEADLARLNLGIEVVLGDALAVTDLEEEELEGRDGEWYTETYRSRQHLGYGKHDGAWEILLLEYRTAYDDTGQMKVSEKLLRKTPLLEASRDLRIAAARQILDLLALIEETAKRKLAALKKVSDSRK